METVNTDLDNILNTVNTDLDNILNTFINNNKDIRPFLKHLEYFGDNKTGTINRSSIATKWSNLSKENYYKNLIKGQITIKSANENGNICPYRHDFKSSDLMLCLKHNSDTDIVNGDGSINIPILKKFVHELFEYNDYHKDYILRRPVLENYLIKCCKRDENKKKHLNGNIICMIPISLPSFKTLAQAEWNDFYLNYTDCWISNSNNNKEQCVSIETFLQFYFKPDVLYKRVLSGELPMTL